MREENAIEFCVWYGPIPAPRFLPRHIAVAAAPRAAG